MLKATLLRATLSILVEKQIPFGISTYGLKRGWLDQTFPKVSHEKNSIIENKTNNPIGNDSFRLWRLAGHRCYAPRTFSW